MPRWVDISINLSGANAQNNSAGAISQSSVPGKPVVPMPATNLNIGMDLWNASSGGAEAAKMRHNQSGAPGVALGDQWVQVWHLCCFFKKLFWTRFALCDDYFTSLCVIAYTNIFWKKWFCWYSRFCYHIWTSIIIFPSLHFMLAAYTWPSLGWKGNGGKQGHLNPSPPIFASPPVLGGFGRKEKCLKLIDCID